MIKQRKRAAMIKQNEHTTKLLPLYPTAIRLQPAPLDLFAFFF
jgi:hypothetical protein